MASQYERENHAGEDGGNGEGTSGERVGAELARALDQAARGLLERGDDESLEQTLGVIVRGAIDNIPRVEQAGISLVERGGTVDSYAPSSQTVRELDELQNQLHEGPALIPSGTSSAP